MYIYVLYIYVYIYSSVYIHRQSAPLCGGKAHLFVRMDAPITAMTHAVRLTVSWNWRNLWDTTHVSIRCQFN